MNCSNIEISVDIEESNFSTKSLLDLIEMDLDDGKGVLHCEVERFSCSYLIEFDHFWIR